MSESGPRGELAKTIPRRPRVTLVLGLAMAFVFALVAMPTITADRWLAKAHVELGKPAPITVRVPSLAGFETVEKRFGNGGIVIGRGKIAEQRDVDNVNAVVAATPKGALPYAALFLLPFVLAAIFTHHLRRSTKGRLVRVQIVSLATILAIAVAVKALMLFTEVSALVVPVALIALVGTIALDRIVGLASGVLLALVVGLLGPFDVGVAIVLLVQAAVAGLVVADQPKNVVRAVAVAGGITTLCTAGTFVLLSYLTTGALPNVADPLHSPWFAALLGPVIASLLAIPLVPLYQMLVGEITRSKLIQLEQLDHPLLKQIQNNAKGTWQHSRAMASMAEAAASAIGADARLVRVGAYFHDLGKSLQPKFFIENLEAGEKSPHDQLAPEVSTDAIFAHVTEGIVTARKAGLHERIVDFMHMHHGNGVLEYFWGKAQEQGNPNGLTIENFRYPGHPPQSRETAILAICDAVEAASRTLKNPDAKSIDALVQRIVYGKLHLQQLDESGLSMADLRILIESLKETVRYANHGRIEYPWQKAQQDASASVPMPVIGSGTQPRLDSLDRRPAPKAEAEATPKPPIELPARPTPKPQIEVVDSKEIVLPEARPSSAIPERDSEPDVEITNEPSRPYSIARDTSQPNVIAREPSGPIAAARTKSGEQPAIAARTKSGEQPAIAARTKSGEQPVVPRTKSNESVPVPSGLGRPGRAPTVPPRDNLYPPAELRAFTPDDPRTARGPSTMERRAASVASDASEWSDRAASSPRVDPAALSTQVGHASGKDASWTERGAQDAPWPELAGEHSERVEVPDPTTTTLRGQGKLRNPVVNKPDTIPPMPAVPPMIVEPRRRAATLPPVPPRKAPTVPPTPIPRRPATVQPVDARKSGPPAPVDLENATTNPPPIRYNTTLAPTATPPRPPAKQLFHEEAPAHLHTDATATGIPKQSDSDLEERVTLPPINENLRTTIPPDDAGRTSPSMPSVDADLSVGDDTSPSLDIQSIDTLDIHPGEERRKFVDREEAATNPAMPRFVDEDDRGLPLRAPPTNPPPSSKRPSKPPPGAKSSLASRIDAAMAGDEWGTETPVKAPTSAELRSLLGSPDPTRQQSIEEIERLHAASRDVETPEPGVLIHPRRSHATHEVDPDDIEAAIEIVPPARRPASIGVAKPKKPNE